MKRWSQVLLLTIVIGMLLCSACSASRSSMTNAESDVSENEVVLDPKTVSNIKISEVKQLKTKSLLSGERESARLLGDLEASSDCIVRGVLEDDAVQYAGQLGRTETSLKISKVYKGNLQAGNTVALVEFYWAEKDEKGDTFLMHYGRYLPTDEGREYVFFLENKKSLEKNLQKRCFGLAFDQEGRYPMIRANEIQAIKDMPNESMNLDKGNVDHYRDLYKQVAEKYMQEESK